MHNRDLVTPFGSTIYDILPHASTTVTGFKSRRPDQPNESDTLDFALQANAAVDVFVDKHSSTINNLT
jgi:hypothetical protein